MYFRILGLLTLGFWYSHMYMKFQIFIPLLNALKKEVSVTKI